ncbi:lipocalin family protein [Nocardia vulneris]|uniref:Lipocalin n=1 Tax=Nocardia vulneris TaxID=1141657 RepID=A0ABR4ZEG9_9NOCA|nr:lipocalin family protein [Nocardia vulneris]KIA63771.1 lipocalin [Nocardia vulneris]
MVLAGFAAAVLSVGSAQAAPVAGPAPVPSLDLNQYLGTWHQLAAVPQYFNLACARDTKANYSLDAQGNVAVRNTCTTWTNGNNEIAGTATVNDRATNAQLHVSFPGVPTQDRLDGPTNYIVTALASDYSWAVVTDPSRLSGFVLARDTRLDPAAWSGVRAGIVAAGQDPCLYLTSPSTGGFTGIVPLCTV